MGVVPAEAGELMNPVGTAKKLGVLSGEPRRRVYYRRWYDQMAFRSNKFIALQKSN